MPSFPNLEKYSVDKGEDLFLGLQRVPFASQVGDPHSRAGLQQRIQIQATPRKRLQVRPQAATVSARSRNPRSLARQPSARSCEMCTVPSVLVK